MKAKRLLRIFLVIALLSIHSLAFADFTFVDERFQGDYSTENLDRMIDAYQLYDGWYWTTELDHGPQTFHGQPDAPGWTETAVVEWEMKDYLPGFYGCRWGVDLFSKWSPSRGGYGECFGFAQFVGYLLSGDVNPQGHWQKYYSIEQSHGLQVGDIVRVEYSQAGHDYHHSAIVYAVYGDEVRFLQVSSTEYNRISVDEPFSNGQFQNLSNVRDFERLPHLKITRAPLSPSAADEVVSPEE